MSVAKIEFPELYEEGTQKPRNGGLLDPRMGTIDRNYKCQTCGEGMAECPGHFAHIDLAKPIYHIGTVFGFIFCVLYYILTFSIHIQFNSIQNNNRFSHKSKEDS
jgi:DNA-directed RNA polymerase beta' subunit